MAAKYQLITGLYEHTAGQITDNHRNWMAFLRSACRNYKCRFDEQLLIFAQRPDATAVLELEKWNKQFGRWVNKGATGIAVFDDEHNGKMRLDTHESRFSRPVPIWDMRERYKSDVIESLENSFGELTDKSDLAGAIISAAHNAVEDNMPDYLTDLMYCRRDSLLEELDELNVEVLYRAALQNSVAYMLLTRCGINADEYFSFEDFQGIINFNTHDTINALGVATSDIAEMGLLEIAATVRNLQIMERRQNRTFAKTDSVSHNKDESRKPIPERSFDDGTDIHHAGRVQPSRPDHAGGTGSSPWEVRLTPQNIPETAPQGTVYQSPDIGQAERTPDGDRTDGTTPYGADNLTDGGGAGLDGRTQSQRPDEMGGTDEQHPAQRGGNRTERPDLQLTLFPTEQEQITSIGQAEDEKSSAFSISQDDIDAVLQRGSGVEHGKFRIYLQFEKNNSTKANADFLKNEYGLGGAYPAIPGRNLDEGHDGKGIKISQGSIAEPDTEILLSWNKAAKRIGELIAADRYFSAREKEQLPAYRQWDEERRTRIAEEVAAREILRREPQEAQGQSVPATVEYHYHLGDTVYIGADEYEVLAFDDDAVRLFDPSFPLINKEIPRSEFDRRVRENPLNDHLKEPAQDLPAEKEQPTTPRALYRAYLPVLLDAVRKSDLLDYLRNRDTDPVEAESELARELYGLVESMEEEHPAFYEAYTSLPRFSDWMTEDVFQRAYQDVVVDPRDSVEQHENLPDAPEWARPEANVTEPPSIASEPEESPQSLVGRRYVIDGREFVVDSIDKELDKISLRDITFQNGAGFPIFRTEHIDFIRAYTPKDEESPLADTPAPKRRPARPKESGVYYPGEITLVEDKMPVPEPAEPALTPSWEKPKPKSRAQTFDLHPEIPMADRHNYVITNDELGHGGAKTKFRNNVEAIKTLQNIELEKRLATPEEQEILSRYVGWGGLPQAFDSDNKAWEDEYLELNALLSPDEYASARASTLNAHYTSPVVIKAIYQAVENMGFCTGNVLEPSCGIGNFFGLVPESMKDSKLFGVELDSVTGRIAQQLYQKNSIAVQGFESTELPDSFFDLAVGNVPFGSYKVSDKKYDKYNFLIHDYFFARTIDKVRPGGIVAFVSSKGTLDKENPAVRKYISQRADLLGAIRLPNNAFLANAGTQVTADIIFLQKRDRLIDVEPDWIHLGKTEDGIPVNSYFIEHPEMILGEMTHEDRMYGNANDTTCKPYPDSNLAELLNEAIQNIHAEITDYELDEMEEADDSIPADPTVRNFSYTVVDGGIYYRENSRMVPVDVSVTGISRIKGMIEIRDCVRTLIEYQTENYPEQDIANEQARLNRLYDRFTTQYGLLNSRANSAVFSNDSAYPLLCSLEVLDENGNLARKAAMFTKRTIKPHTPVTSVDTASEALAVSLAEKARVDIPFMEQLTGKDEEVLVSELEGVIFRIPAPKDGAGTPVYQTADEYLSGNVREKLQTARMALEVSDLFAPNVAALEKVQPKDLSASEISVRLGATWLPPEIVQQFMFELLSTPRYSQYNIKIHYSALTAQWNVEGKSYDRGNIKASSTYGTNRINAYKIIEETLNLRDVRIFDTVEDEQGNEKRVLNKKETAIAQSKQELIKAQFAEWIWKDPDRRERLVRIYNDKFNCIRPREYDGSHIKFVGINPEIELRPHQINAIAHVLYGGNTLLAHVVGAGKTFEMVAAAQESKRLGLCNKSLFVVPNHITEQWAADYLQLYPSANILVATKKDFETKNRKKFCGRIATGDYDAVIIGHSQFEKIPISIERQRSLLEQQMDEIVDGIAELKENRGEKFTIKQLERTKKSIQAKLEKLNDQSRKDYGVVTFEELGVDRLFIDESHYYKNLFLFTKMRNVGGIAQIEAQKSSDLFMKCRYLDEITSGHGVVFATGTPISNSMVELYTIQRYLQYETLIRNGLQHFDEWASTFGETVTAIELAPEGTGYRAKTRFAKFYNLPELMSMFREVADIQTADMLDLPVPKVNYHNIAVKPSEFQLELVAELSERAEAVRKGDVDPHIDNMLKITNDGRKLALDQRLINSMLPDSPDSKVAVCAGNVYDLWEKHKNKRLTQLIFCDLSTPHYDDTFNVYDDMKAKLVARGVPNNEVVFIHDAKTDMQKKEVFAKVRSGQIRNLLGSTQKMGAGTNVQDLLIAMHDLDCPWRPSDLEQRKGRIERQGNKNEEVEVFRYVTENTFDAYLYQLVENKQRFISQIMTSKSPVRSAEDIDETALSYAEIKALATGNPHIKEKMDLDVEVARLKMLKANHLSQKYALEDQLIKFFPRQIKQAEERIAGYKADIEVVRSKTPAEKETFPPMVIHGTTYDEKAEAGKALIEACKQMTSPDPIPIGSYRGFQMELAFDTFGKEYRITLKNELSHTVSLGSDIYGNITRLDNTLEGMPARMTVCAEQLENTRTQMENARIQVEQPFSQEEALQTKSKRLDELNIMLNMDEKDHTLIDAEPDEGDFEMKKVVGLER